jgi:DnaJ family protein A protein 2
MSSDDYYKILGISRDASESEIKKKYRQMIKKFHPDKIGKEKGDDMAKKINKAYGVLKDPEKKQIYDQFGEEGLNGNMHGAGGVGGFNMEDIFRQMHPGGMGGMGGMGGFNRQRQQEPQVEPIKFMLNISLEDIFNGISVEKEITRKNLCKGCDATGFSDKKTHICKSCNGNRMKVKMTQLGPEMFTQSQVPCSECSATGMDTKSTNKCSECDGRKFNEKRVIIKFNLPKGIEDQSTFQLGNQGNEIPVKYRPRKDITRGPIHVAINQLDHKTFKRGTRIGNKINAANLAIICEVSFEESIIGFVREITHLDGKKFVIKETGFVKDDDTRVVIGQGLQVQGSDYKVGDLFVRYTVKYPENLPDDKKRGIYKILTGKKYKEPSYDEKCEEVTLVDIEKYNNQANSNAYDSDEDNGHGNPREGCKMQ